MRALARLTRAYRNQSAGPRWPAARGPGQAVLAALTWSEERVEAPPLIRDVIGARLG